MIHIYNKIINYVLLKIIFNKVLCEEFCICYNKNNY